MPAHAHLGYLFANARATRIKLLVHDGFGVWCAARRLNAGHFGVAARSGGGAVVADAEPVRRFGRGPALAAPARDERDHADVRPAANLRTTDAQALTGVAPMA